MVLPLWDENPLLRPKLPWVTWTLVALNTLIFCAEAGSADATQTFIVAHYGLIPATLFRHPIAAAGGIPSALTLISSMFLHEDWLHCFGNMLFLWIFGDDVEEALGPWRFILFYFACGIAAGLAYAITAPESSEPVIGASGAIAGVLAAYVMFRPCRKVIASVFGYVTKIDAFWVIGLWALWQLVEIAINADDGVAYAAHIGGLAIGAILFPLMRQPGVELFECFDDPPATPQGADPA